MTDGIVWGIVGVILVVALIAVWRVLVHDRTISRVRFGVFYERERENEDEPDDGEPRKDNWHSDPVPPPAPRE